MAAGAHGAMLADRDQTKKRCSLIATKQKALPAERNQTASLTDLLFKAVPALS
jgi:hypothetical protein